MSTSSAERAARRIINAWNNCLLDDAPQPDVESIAAIIREELARDDKPDGWCDLCETIHEPSGEPKGEGKQ